MRSGWQVVLYRLAERGQIVERHRREHVVLYMILHVPIEEPDKPTAGEGAAAEPEVRRVGHQTDVLGHSAEHDKPTAVINRQVDQEDQNPLTCGDEEGRQSQMAEQNHTGPFAVAAAKFLILLGKDFLHPLLPTGEKPLALEVAARVFEPFFQSAPNSDRIRKRNQQPEPELYRIPVHLLRKDYLAVMVVVRGDLVMLHMAHAKADRIAPCQEREHIHKQIVQPLPAEWRLVNQLVHCHQTHEPGKGAVKEDKQCEQWNHPCPVCLRDTFASEIGPRARAGVETQMQERLAQCLSIVALHQAAHNGFIHFRAIPVDFELFVHGRSKQNISASTSPYPH